MATRVLITDLSGFPLASLDGHHGATHAVRWTADMRARLAADGIETMVFELTPSAGGDTYRKEVLERIGQLRFEFHRRPDGKREIVGAVALPRGNGKSAAASMPAAPRFTAHIVDAPEDIHGTRRPIRVPRGRMNGTAPRTPDERRLARRLERARDRG